jgi:hypothetical protein
MLAAYFLMHLINACEWEINLTNRELDWTIFDYTMFYLETGYGTEQNRQKGHKTRIFLTLLNHKTTFCPWYNYKNYENTHFISEYKKYYLSLSHLFYLVMLCSTLFCHACTVLLSTYYFANQTHISCTF